jgi:hypothetical protein
VLLAARLTAAALPSCQRLRDWSLGRDDDVTATYEKRWKSTPAGRERRI